MRPIRSVAAVLAGLAVLIVVGTTAPARAATEPVQLSNDGRTWTPDLARPLFDPATRWVPGDVRRAAFWVRNAGPTVGSLAVTARVQDTDGLMADDAIDLELREAGGAWTGVTPGATLTLASLPAGADTRVEVRATYPWSSGNDTMRRTLSFSFGVRLSGDDVAATAGPTSAGPSATTTQQSASQDRDSGVSLPNTGNPVDWWWLLLAAAALGGGTALVVRSKRKDTP